MTPWISWLDGYKQGVITFSESFVLNALLAWLLLFMSLNLGRTNRSQMRQHLYVSITTTDGGTTVLGNKLKLIEIWGYSYLQGPLMLLIWFANKFTTPLKVKAH